MKTQEQLVDKLGGKAASLEWYAQNSLSQVPLLPYTIVPVVDGVVDSEKLEEIVEKFARLENCHLIFRASAKGDEKGIIDTLPTISEIFFNHYTLEDLQYFPGRENLINENILENLKRNRNRIREIIQETNETKI